MEYKNKLNQSCMVPNIVISLYCLHLLRNITAVYAVIPLIITLLALVLIDIKKYQFDKVGLFFIVCFIISMFYSVLISFLNYPYEAYAIAVVRFFYLFPFILYALFFVEDRKVAIQALKIIALFVALGAFSMFYQIFYGPITWLADSSSREGLSRYASTVGSLTSYGVVGGLTLPIIFFLFESRLIRYLLLGVVVLGMLVTLQKAAVANIFIFLGFLAFNQKRKIYFALIIIFFILFIWVSYLVNIPYIVATVDNVLRINSGSGITDVNVIQSASTRLWDLPSRLYSDYGLQGIFFGVGFVGGSGTLGFAEFPMAHNNLFDLLFIGGFFYLGSFAMIYLIAIKRLIYVNKKQKISLFATDSFDKTCLYIILLFGFNFLFTSGLIYQPYSTMIIFIVLWYYTACPQYYDMKSRNTVLDPIY